MNKQIMTTEIMDRAWNNFHKFFGISQEGRIRNEFWSYIGIQSGSHVGITDDNKIVGWPATPEQAQLVRAMAGPHYHAMIKAYEAKKNG